MDLLRCDGPATTGSSPPCKKLVLRACGLCLQTPDQLARKSATHGPCGCEGAGVVQDAVAHRLGKTFKPPGTGSHLQTQTGDRLDCRDAPNRVVAAEGPGQTDSFSIAANAKAIHMMRARALKCVRLGCVRLLLLGQTNVAANGYRCECSSGAYTLPLQGSLLSSFHYPLQFQLLQVGLAYPVTLKNAPLKKNTSWPESGGLHTH